jgi:sugar phosphate isomerase/epimerase
MSPWPQPPVLGPEDLILSHFSLGRFLPFEERVRAAAEAGFAALGFYVGDYQRLRALGTSDADLRAVLNAHGMRVVELEALRGWSASGEGEHRYRQDEDAVFRMNDALGPADSIQVIGSYEGSLDQAAQAFAGLCDRLASQGLAAAVEFLPEMTNIPDAATAMSIVTAADRPNGGLCVDSWHHFRGANDDQMLASVPAERVLTVQIDDGPRHRIDPDYYTDCTHYRQLPGQGAFDLVHFLRLLGEMGVRRPLSVEVMSDGLHSQSPGSVARQLAESTRDLLRAVLEQVDSPVPE